MASVKFDKDSSGSTMTIGGVVTLKHDFVTDMITVDCSEHGRLRAMPDGIFIQIAKKFADDHYEQCHAETE